MNWYLIFVACWLIAMSGLVGMIGVLFKRPIH